MAKRVTVTGLDRVNRNLRRLGRDAPRVVGSFLFQEGEAIMAEAIPITPVDKGPLRGSGHVELPKQTRTGMEVELGFGGAAAPYAVWVHEKLDVHHNPPTRAKYLEQPFKRRMKGFVGRLARRVRREIMKLRATG